MRIGRRISTALLLSAFAATLATGSVLYSIARGQLEKEIHARLGATAQSRARHIQTYLKEHSNRIKLLSGDEILISALTADRTESAETGSSALNARLSEVLSLDGQTRALSVYGLTGARVAGASMESGDGQGETCPHCPRALEAFYISDIHADEDGLAHMSMLAPVRFESEIVGYLVSYVDLGGLYEILSDRTGLGKTGEVYLVNQDGYMISPSRFDDNAVLNRKVDTANSRACLLHTGTEHVIDTYRPLIFADYRGVEVLGTHEYIPEMKWCLLNEIDSDEALAPLHRLQFAAAVSIIAFPLFGWLIGARMSRAIVSPVERLRGAVDAMRAGRSAAVVEGWSNDEIGELGRAFDEMTSNLGEATATIGELKETQLRLRRTKDELQTIFDTAPLLMWFKDLQGNHLQVTEYFCRALGLKREMVLGKSDADIFPEDLARRYQEDDLEVVATGKAKMGIVQRYPMASGNVAWCRTDKIPKLDEEGRVIGLVGIAMDITGLKRAEQALAESETKFRSIFENAHEGVLVVDTETSEFQSFNGAMCRMLGYSETEMDSLNLADIQADGGLLSIIEQSDNRAVNDAGLASNIALKQKDGSMIHVEVAVTWLDLDGKKHLMCAFRDVSKRLQAETQVQIYVKELEQFNRLAVDRELRMVGLKEEINRLLANVGEEAKYAIVE